MGPNTVNLEIQGKPELNNKYKKLLCTEELFIFMVAVILFKYSSGLSWNLLGIASVACINSVQHTVYKTLTFV